MADPEELDRRGVLVSQYGFFRMNNVKKSIELKNTTCPIQFCGGNKDTDFPLTL